MTFNCCVPFCKMVFRKNSNVKFHKFPTEKRMVRKWVAAIKSGKQPTRHTKICSKHFRCSDYIGGNYGIKTRLHHSAIPSKHIYKSFTKSRNVSAISSEQHQEENQLLMLDENEDNSDQRSENNYQQEEPPILPTFNELSPIHTISEHNGSKFKDVALSPIIKETKSVSTNTYAISAELKSYYYEVITVADLHFYTGFTRQRFEFLFNTIGIYSTRFDVYIPVKDQLVLTLTKIRLNMYYKAIGRFYGISRFCVKKIFIFWLQKLYNAMMNVDWWSLRANKAELYTVILDCTEVLCEKSDDPELNQVLFSTYKNHHTVKFLVGIDEFGTVIFVSKGYGGSVSDRQIVEDSGILALLKRGDIVAADKGFNISDLLEDIGVALNTPPRLGNREQLTRSEVLRTNILGNRRIPVEWSIGVAKNNRILKDYFKQTLFTYVDAIIYVSTLLSNFKDPLIN